MTRRLQRGLSLPRLRALLALLFLALAVPSAVLVVQTQGQLKWEAFHTHRDEAESLSARIDASLRAAMRNEEMRGQGEYAFLVAAGDPALSNLVQRSPLAAYPVDSPLPGVLGYFQVDDQGRFSSPLLPPDASSGDQLGVSASEWQQRVALHNQLFGILSSNVLADAPLLAEPSIQEDESDDSLADRDKATGALAAQVLVDLGFRIVATSGTARFLGAEGIEVDQVVAKVTPGAGGDDGADGVELISSGAVQMVVNSPRGRGPRADGAHLRRAAGSAGVPLLTTASAALAAARGLVEATKGEMSVRSLQDWHARSRGPLGADRS